MKVFSKSVALLVPSIPHEAKVHTAVNDTSSSRGLDALPDGPLSNLIGAGGEEAVQVQDLTHGGDDLGQTRLGVELLALLLDGSIVAQLGHALLEGSGDGEHGIAGGVGLDPLDDLGQVLVLLAHVVLLAQIDQVHNRLGREKEERVDDLDLRIVSVLNLTAMTIQQPRNKNNKSDGT